MNKINQISIKKSLIYLLLPKHFFKLFLSIIVVTSLITNIHAETPNKNYSYDSKSIQEVMDGTRTEANAAWWGFNEIDSTNALQRAIKSKATKIVVPNTGKPWVVEPIVLESNKEITFEEGVVIEAKTGSFLKKTDALFRAVNKKNIILNGYGAEFIMRKQDYTHPPYEKSEWRHCISIQGCQTIKIFGLRVVKSGGDGIFIDRGSGKDGLANSDDILIKDVTCDQNYRQGISIISASNLLIEDCTFQYTDGTWPKDGIDFEPDHSDEILSNCKIQKCTFSYNSGTGITINISRLDKNSRPIGIEITDCKVSKNKQGPIRIRGKNPKTEIGGGSGKISIKNCDLDGKIELIETQMLDINTDKNY
jgi:hypothetical protein